MSVNMSESGAVGLRAGVGSYQPGVYVPLKALFLVFGICDSMSGVYMCWVVVGGRRRTG